MLSINGQLCYSPKLPDEYGGKFGHGGVYGKDVQLWNLVYLSVPEIEMYLQPDVDRIEVFKRIEPAHVAACLATVRGDNCKRLFPHMRRWLQLPPLMFLRSVLAIPTERRKIIPVVATIPNWSSIASTRAWIITRSDPAQKSVDKLIKELT